jgi:AcrR family transcriptional regulator
MTRSTDDRRRQRTRRALFVAFAELVLAGRYDDIRVHDIARRAGVGRSTFYDHFGGKEQLVLESMTGFLSVIADAAAGATDETLAGVLGHFWQNRRLARRLLLGDSIAPRIEKLHAQLVTERVATRLGGALDLDQPGTGVPWRLMAAQIAAAQLGLVRSWLVGNIAGRPDLIAETLIRASTSLVHGLASPSPGRTA